MSEGFGTVAGRQGASAFNVNVIAAIEALAFLQVVGGPGVIRFASVPDADFEVELHSGGRTQSRRGQSNVARTSVVFCVGLPEEVDYREALASAFRSFK